MTGGFFSLLNLRKLKKQRKKYNEKTKNREELEHSLAGCEKKKRPRRFKGPALNVNTFTPCVRSVNYVSLTQ